MLVKVRSRAQRPTKASPRARLSTKAHPPAAPPAAESNPVAPTTPEPAVLFSSKEFDVHQLRDALNALTEAMALDIHKQLVEWETSPYYGAFEMVGSGGKAFCAGGDIRTIYDIVKKDPVNGPLKAAEFFKEEYTMNWALGTTQLAQVSYIDGITMGGGFGLSVHGDFRIATENTVFAMPETAIGFFPDVGGSYFLPRVRNHWGYYLALTGRQIKGLDTLYANVATHFIRAKDLPNLRKQLREAGPLNFEVIFGFFVKAMEKSLPKQEDAEAGSTRIFKDHGEAISKAFSQPTVKDILEALKSNPDQWAKEARTTILEKVSPMSVMVTFDLLNRGAKLANLGECLEQEYAVAQHFMHEPDFFEGVRALLVDKDKNPKWQHKSISEITPEDVALYFDKESHKGKKLDKIVLHDAIRLPVRLIHTEFMDKAFAGALRLVPPSKYAKMSQDEIAAKLQSLPTSLVNKVVQRFQKLNKWRKAFWSEEAIKRRARLREELKLAQELRKHK